MKLFSFGDSWTEGVGGNLKEEYTTDIPEERTKIRHKYCWPNYLSKLLNCEYQNDGVGAYSNNVIFNSISARLKSDIITKDDFVIVMWSSSLRDDLPFFPNTNSFTMWGKRYKNKQHLYRFIFEQSDNDGTKHARLEKNFRDYYVSNLFTDTYYDIVNQNYILYLQFMFKEMGIRYLFCDAFDSMISTNLISDIDRTEIIDKTHYWGFKEKTMANFLIDLKRKDVWEDYNYWIGRTQGKHPNSEGYKIIANEFEIVFS